MNIGDDEDEVKDDNKDSGFYCMGCDDFRVELDCIKRQQGDVWCLISQTY